MPGCPGLNDLFVHPRLSAFVRRTLGTDDVSIHQAAAWAKWAGAIADEQPLHHDTNNSLLPRAWNRASGTWRRSST